MTTYGYGANRRKIFYENNYIYNNNVKHIHVYSTLYA